MLFECQFCKNNYESRSKLTAHARYCQKRKDKLSLITKNDLMNLYHEKKMSCQDISDYFEIKLSDVFDLMKKFNITRRKLSTACKLCTNKREKTHLEKYGTKHNFCRESKCRIQMEKDLFDKHGVTNVFQLPHVKEKILNTMIEKYGKENINKIKTSRGRKVYSSIHRKVVEICQNLDLDISIEFKIKKNNKRYYAFDIILNDTKKLIEVNGDYWHGNPKFYKKDDIILKGSTKEIIVADKWRADKVKNKFAQKLGYEILVIWENDIKNDLELVINKIKLYSQS